ncbi:MAG: pyridoxal phosphate-dependent aminotransferase [Actinomycetota bacterium]
MDDLLHPRLQGFGTTIFTEMSALAARTGAINLGQGFPDSDGPIEVADAAAHALRNGANQYPPLPGLPELRHAVAEHQRRFYGIELDADRQVQVTVGATEAIAAALLALCGPGDEVVALDPTYDSYAASIAMSGATKRVVKLRAPDLALDPAELRAAVNDRTKVLLINSPHNPSGKVLDDDERQAIAEIAVEHDLVVVTDEVYEHLVFDGEHVPLSTLPGMAERTLSISSGGKTFSFTGWKVGWATGPAELVTAVRTAKQFLTFSGGGPFQRAIAVGLGLGDDYYGELREDFRAKRDLLCDGLAAAGFDVIVPQGAYFVTVDIRPLGTDDGVEFCRALPERCGVVGIPSSVFHDDPADARSLVRFAFCKRRQVLDDAVSRLVRLGA